MTDSEKPQTESDKPTTDHPAPGSKFPLGGVDWANDEQLTCLRCGDLATRGYEGSHDPFGFFELCEDCHDELGDWLRETPDDEQDDELDFDEAPWTAIPSPRERNGGEFITDE